jgi:hypothetical protein
MLRILFTILATAFVMYSRAGVPETTGVTGSKKGNEFMVGFKIGINFTQPIVFQKFNILSPVDQAVNQSGTKTYRLFYRNPGYQYAFTVLYKLTEKIDIRFEPTFSTYNYFYNTSFFWENSGANSERIDMLMLHKQSVKYVELPVTMRWLIGSGKLRPFTQGGVFLGVLQNAIKTANRTETYTNALGTSTLNAETISGGAGDLYRKMRFGVNGGVGLDYEINSIHITLDINLNMGFNTISSKSSRYSMQQYAGGLYDVQDNLKLLVPSINLGVLIPLLKPLGQIKCPTI